MTAGSWPLCTGDAKTCVCRACCIKRGGLPNLRAKERCSDATLALLGGKPGFVLVFDLDFDTGHMGVRGESNGPNGTVQLMEKAANAVMRDLTTPETDGAE